LALGAVVSGIYFPNLNGIYSSGTTDTDLIRSRCPIRLIQPEWMSGQPDILTNWILAEIRARQGLIAMLWLASASVLVWRDRRKETTALPPSNRFNL
jgi:hypothetical protein